MKTSIVHGGPLPESYDEFEKIFDSGKARYTTCCQCQEPFSDWNTFSPPGWRETQITGMCEQCFDDLFKED